MEPDTNYILKERGEQCEHSGRGASLVLTPADIRGEGH